MNTLLKSIALNETSYNVALLHKALGELGLPVNKTEANKNEAGPDTLAKVRALQARLEVPVDDRTLMNEPTVSAFEDALRRSGLMAASRSFTVTGTVRRQDGSVKKRQRLIAFDLDLRGVAVYRTVKKLSEIRQNNGFEFLGITSSDNRGKYELTFYDWQYHRAERKKADVVVYAIDEGKEDSAIIGFSRMVNSDDYSEKGLVRDVDIILVQTDARTEYEIVMTTLSAFMKESGTTLLEISKSAEQLSFTASELDLELARVNIAATAESLLQKKDRQHTHELLYGIGRQNIRLDWLGLYRKPAEELRIAINKSIETHIIHKFDEKEIASFLDNLHDRAARMALDIKKADGSRPVDEMLANALPKETQRISFLKALNSFKGSDFREFWNKHLPEQPEFKENPALISNLLLTQQFTVLTGNHPSLVKELQVERKLESVGQLMDLEQNDWAEIIKKTGMPDFIQGANDEEKAKEYISQIQTLLNTAFPTQRIARMVSKDELPIEKNAVSRSIKKFLADNPQFDFSKSHIHKFKKEIQAAAGESFTETRTELKKIQRVFQVSTDPGAMKSLMESKLHSAYTIVNIPRKSFIKTYGKTLGGEQIAFAIHQRAEHIATRTELSAMHIMEYSHGLTPQTIMSKAEHDEAMQVIESNLPNPSPTFEALFGSPDICECEQCRSVYSAAAYLVELLRFLWRSEPNGEGQTPLDLLAKRRPDLLYLQLTCENTNTIIPYIDLANEVMEFYTANDSLTAFKGFDTGEATTDELRANPQNFNLDAYRKLKDAKYPFTLPFHQPLDVIRTYSDHLKVSRYEAMKAVNPLPDTTTVKAIAAESLRISEEEYKVLTGQAFNGAPDPTTLYEYFGYAAIGDLENLSAVREFLKRSGITYTDLVELVKTQFINPYQNTLDFLTQVFAHTSESAVTLYARLEHIEAGTPTSEDTTIITAALTAYNTEHETSISPVDFTNWIQKHLGEFRQVITLFEPESKCDLDTTKLRTIQSIYTNLGTCGLTNTDWSKFHRFIRLWRKLGWTIHETDLMLAALGESDITPDTIRKLEFVSLLKTATDLPLNQLAVLWGNIDSYGKKSLYAKLFLNRAVQQIDKAFEADAWGGYLQDGSKTFADHQSAILAAFRMREDDLFAILQIAKVMDNNNPRLLSKNDILNLGNLSTIYRYIIMAKALKIRIADLCKLTDLFTIPPFSIWDIQQKKFINVTPADTYRFYQLANAIKKSGFKASVLDYILRGTLSADSKFGLDKEKVLQIASTIREAFSAIEQNHSSTLLAPLTTDILTAKLSLTYQPETVNRLMGILDGTATFQTSTDANLNVVIPTALSGKVTYVKGKGTLTCSGIMPDAERTALAALPNVNAHFQSAVQELYDAPENFLKENLKGIITDFVEAITTLLDRPPQSTAATLEKKLEYIYIRFIPVLKAKLRRETIVQHIAALIGLSETSASVLIDQDIESLTAKLSTEGFSAIYFPNATWANPAALTRTDLVLDFDWETSALDPAVPANNFSVRWDAYLSAPSSGEYTLRVDVAEADEAFKLYLDGNLIVEKISGVVNLSWDIAVTLNATRMHLLRLDYAETNQNAGVHLRWMKATSAPEIIPASVAYPTSILIDFVSLATTYHRAAKFILGFGLSETELNHLITYAGDFDNVNFKALTTTHWQRVSDYIALRNTVPQSRALLTDIFATANRTTPAPTLSDLKVLVNQAAAWEENNLAFLVDNHFGLATADFKNEIVLNRLREVLQIVAKTGLSAQTIVEWGKAETDFDALYATGQLIKNTVKSKYEEKDWLELAGNLSDVLRKNQQQALIAYLLTRSAIQDWGAEDADGLFEYFLIDVQMGSCMDTSRVVQANAAIQMFVNRCLLNLESDASGGAEKGVSPGMIDRDRWEWMKNYRVWEANRKVFLYPENWLEPEWRNDRSEFFKELESYLVQNDITDRSAEQAFRNYLTSLNEVANLEVCGLHLENYDDGRLKYLHVFARTHNAPYKYFYRRWNEFRKWSAWERVPVDIRSVENGDNSGVHLIPVVWKKRLFLFWPEFREVQETPDNSTQSIEHLAKNSNIEALGPRRHWEISLAWSEHIEEKWTPKQVTKEFIKHGIGKVIPQESRLRWIYTIDSDQRLQIVSQFEFEGAWVEVGLFLLSDVASKVEVRYFNNNKAEGLHENGWGGYLVKFMSYQRDAKLELLNDVYLKNSHLHKLLLAPVRGNYLPTLKDPFFFTDPYRTYFVRPVVISITEGLRRPDFFPPSIQRVFEEIRPPVLDRIPSIGPDNYIPIDVITPEAVGRIPALVYRASGGVHQPRMLVAPRSSSTKTSVMSSTIVSWADAPVWDKYISESAYIEKSFGSLSAGMYGYAWGRIQARQDTGLEFHTFYHPFSSKFVTRLNQGGIPALMGSDTENPSFPGAIKSDNGSTFENVYNPNFEQGFVQKPQNPADLDDPDNFSKRTYYKENVCFDVYGANNQYNWELFFHAPLYIATRLSKNGKYEEAMKWFHYIFDPTTDDMPDPGESETSRYWKVLPFKSRHDKSIKDWFRDLSPNTNPNTENIVIKEWRDNPFDAHLVASNRPLAYMKNVVIKYVENLIAWGDSLFRQFQRESVYEAIQIYVVANHILGPRPQFVPKRGDTKAESYDSLKAKWDDFSNALVELENIFPYSSEASVSSSSTGTSLLGLGSALYFCIPSNEKLLEHWDTVADRLYKIRHCQDIDGVERHLALFSPPIDPGALIQANSQGLSLGSILADLSSPPPIYRFTYLIQKANEFCSDVKALGSALLAALEKKDAEELGRLRASHETQMLELITAVKERQVLDAKTNKENLEKTRITSAFRLQHYIDLLGNDSVTVPASPQINANLTVDSQLPADTNIVTVVPDVDESLVDSDESGVKLIPKEKEDIDKASAAMISQQVATAMEGLAGILHLIPDLTAAAEPFGIGVGTRYGGSHIGSAVSGLAKVPQIFGAVYAHEAAQAAKTAGFIRREQDWTLQANLAAREIIQLDKQITSADIRIQVAEKELENHKKQIENAQQVELFLKDKFTNQELYQWMKEQIFAAYKQSYNLAFDMAKKVEKAYKYEMGTELASFIQYGYWDSSKQGLMAGEKLQLALRQMEKSYLEDNRRELELTKSISLVRLDPLTLIELRETGKCYVSLPEELFDLDFRGHYFRRIKSVRLSIPCVAGPYTSVSCTLRLLNNSVRINTSIEPQYEHNNDEGIPTDDERFHTNYTPVTSIATSSAQNDSGTFEFNFRDERYLPFELAGAISKWQLELSTEKELRSFDYSTVSDVILHLNYTARESGGLFKNEATTHIKNFLKNAAELVEQPLVQMFSMKHEFPTEWHKFLYPGVVGAEQILNFVIGKERFPFLVQERDVVVMEIDLFAKCTKDEDYHSVLSYFSPDDDPVVDASTTSGQIVMTPSLAYGGLNKATVESVNLVNITLEEVDITKRLSLKLKRSTVINYTSLATNPSEIADIFLVVHYKLDDISN